MTLLRTCLMALATTFAFSSLNAHADSFHFVVGGGGGYSGVGVLTTTATGSGDLITSMVGTGVTGLLDPGTFNGNDNLVFPDSVPTLDANGFSFAAVNGPDTFDVNIFNDGTGYSAFFRDEDNFTATIPVTFAISRDIPAVPEPSTLLLLGTGLLGAAGSMRRKLVSDRS